MPNRPDDPYPRFPPTAAIGLLLMLSGTGALLVLNTTWLDWRRILLGALFLVALVGAFVALRCLKLGPFVIGRIKRPSLPLPVETAALPSFDHAGFVEAVRQRQPEPQGVERREKGTVPGQPRAIGPETVRRLQDLRDHPATPPAEREAADDKLKKARAKRRSAWGKRP